MANIFRKLGQRIFGRKPATSVEEMQAQRREDVARDRAERARREAQEAAAQMQRLGEMARQRPSGAAAEALRRATLEAAKKRSDAQHEEARAKYEAERWRAKREDLQAKARIAELRTDDEAFQRIREGAKPIVYPDKKMPGVGELPMMGEFMRGHPISRFASSNVLTIQYDPTKKILHVQYLRSGKWYGYFGCDARTALESYSAASKGIFVWDRIRVRGSGNQRKTRMRYQRDMPPPSYLPLRTEKEASPSVTAQRG